MNIEKHAAKNSKSNNDLAPRKTNACSKALSEQLLYPILDYIQNVGPGLSVRQRHHREAATKIQRQHQSPHGKGSI
jgi:hypothetical protein